MRVEDDGERRRGREGGFSFLSSRSNQESSERKEELLSVEKMAEIANDLTDYDRNLANEFARLAKRATTDEVNRKALDEFVSSAM